MTKKEPLRNSQGKIRPHVRLTPCSAFIVTNGPSIGFIALFILLGYLLYLVWHRKLFRKHR